MSKMPKRSSSPRTRFKLKEPSAPQEAQTLPLSEYSRRVKLLRKILPLAGLVLLIVVIAWPLSKQVYENQFEEAPSVSKKLLMEDRLINPKLVDTDEKDHPFTLTAESSVQGQDTQSTLEKPQGKMQTDQETDVEITADTGDFDRDAGILTYKKNVVLKTNDGYVFNTQQAQVHLKTQIADGQDPITGHGPAGEIAAAQGFKLDKNQKTLRFYGQTRLILLDKKQGAP